MPAPLLIAGGLMAGASAMSYGANLYSQSKQRELYSYQRNAYERQLRDYIKNVGRPIRYPELSYPGHIRALDIGYSQSLASSFGSTAGLVRSLAGTYAGGIGASNLASRSYNNGYARARSLYSQVPSRSSRWL